MALEIPIAFEKNLDVLGNLNFFSMEIEIVLEKKRSFFSFSSSFAVIVCQMFGKFR